MTPTLSDYYVPPTIRRIKKCVRCRKQALAYSIEGLCPECHEEWLGKKDAALKEFIRGTK